MYNAARKEEWLNSCGYDPASKDFIQRVQMFDRLEDAVESPLGDDVYELMIDGRRDDILQSLSDRGRFFTYVTLRRFLTMVNSYLIWCYASQGRRLVFTQAQKLFAYEVSLIPSYTKYFIRTQDELESALIEHPVQEGKILPVCASLAWMGYTVGEMCKLRREEVETFPYSIAVRGRQAPVGFIAETLRYFATHDSFVRGAQNVLYVKEDSPFFLCNIGPADSTRRQASDMSVKIRQLAQYVTVKKTGDSLSFRQLVVAGEFHRMIALEQSGVPITVETMKQAFGITGQTALDRLREFEQFKEALRR